MARSPLTETYKRVEGMVAYVRENLNPGEYDLFLDMVAPQPEPEPPAKKTRKKRTTKSAKAQSIENAIRSSHEAKSEGALVFDGTPCTAKVPGLDVVCGETADRLIHDPNGGYGGYHPFESSAPAVERKSKRKAVGANSTPSTETNSEGALTAGAGGD